MIKLFFLSLFTLLIAFPGSILAQNLSNGNFEDGTFGWNAWGGRAASENPRSGEGLLIVENDIAKWSGVHQVLPLPEEASFVSLGGWIRTQNVVGGVKDWERARIAIEFLDDDDKMVGDYLPALGQIEGTHDWSSFLREYTIPLGATQVKIIPALGNATGLAAFDDISVLYWNKDGKCISSVCEQASESAQETDSKSIPGSAQKVNPKENSLGSPGFEKIGIWNTWGGAIQPWDKHSGTMALQVSNAEPTWSGADQIFGLPASARHAKVSGWMKTQNVKRGEKDFEQARFSVEFLDKKGELINGYPPVSADTVGTTDWTYYEKEYDLPAGTALFKMVVALGNATGTAWFDDLAVVITDSSGNVLEPRAISGPMDEGQWYALPVNPENTAGHWVDWSSLLDAPAGKHGFVKAKGDELVFENGTPAKFWGINLVANTIFDTHEKMDSLALRLARMGANLVRLHHMDAPWSDPNIFGNSKENTLYLDSSALDRMDYLIAAMKKRGIYTYIDLLVHREFYEGDSIDAPLPDLGGKQVGIFNRRIIDLQKRFAQQLFTHKNPYTGNTYAEEPAIVGTEYINESTIFTHFSKDLLQGTPYRTELETRWKKAGHKGELSTFTHNWKPTNRGILKVEEHPESAEASIRFLKDIELDYYKEMREFITGLGVKFPLSGTNYPPQILATLHNNASQDVIISNDYWDHPQVWLINDDWSRVQWAPLHNRSQLMNPISSLIHTKSFPVVKDMPYIITEWNHCGWNEYMLEGVPLMAFYGAFQGWDGMIQFDMDHKALGEDHLKQLTLSRQPEDLMQWVVAAPAYLRGDIKKSPTTFVEDITPKQIYSDSSYSSLLEDNAWLPFATAIRKNFVSSDSKTKPPVKKFSSQVDSASGIVQSSTKELEWNFRTGLLKVNADRVQGFTGFLGDTTTLETQWLKVALKNSHASVLAVSADGKSLKKSDRIFLVAAGPSKGTGRKYNASRNALTMQGRLPILTQKLEGFVELKSNKSYKIKWLAADGSIIKESTLKPKKGVVRIPVEQGISPVMELSKL